MLWLTKVLGSQAERHHFCLTLRSGSSVIGRKDDLLCGSLALEHKAEPQVCLLLGAHHAVLASSRVTYPQSRNHSSTGSDSKMAQHSSSIGSSRR